MRRYIVAVVLILIQVVLLSITCIEANNCNSEQDTLSLENASVLVTAIRAYSSEHIYAPASLSILVEFGYMDVMPTNPYTCSACMQLSPGDDVSPGDFIYLPAEAKYSFKDGRYIIKQSEWYLIVFGRVNMINIYDDIEFGEKLDLGKDIGVLSVFQSAESMWLGGDGIKEPWSMRTVPLQDAFVCNGWLWDH